MQLIGLEKRFENQKYLSTPDRIQLADSLGLSQLQVKTWYQNRRMKWKKKVLKEGSHEAPTKPKGRPKKNSIPSFSEIIKAAAEAAEAGRNNSNNSGSSSNVNSNHSCSGSDLSASEVKNTADSMNDSDNEDDDDEDENTASMDDDDDDDDDDDENNLDDDSYSDDSGEDEQEQAYANANDRLSLEDFIAKNAAAYNFVK
jgi:hypothetical protein